MSRSIQDVSRGTKLMDPTDEEPRPFAVRFAEPLRPSDPPPNIPWAATTITTWDHTGDREDPRGSDPD